MTSITKRDGGFFCNKRESGLNQTKRTKKHASSKNREYVLKKWLPVQDSNLD